MVKPSVYLPKYMVFLVKSLKYIKHICVCVYVTLYTSKYTNLPPLVPQCLPATLEVKGFLDLSQDNPPKGFGRRMAAGGAGSGGNALSAFSFTVRNQIAHLCLPVSLIYPSSRYGGASIRLSSHPSPPVN